MDVAKRKGWLCVFFLFKLPRKRCAIYRWLLSLQAVMNESINSVIWWLTPPVWLSSKRQLINLLYSIFSHLTACSTSALLSITWPRCTTPSWQEGVYSEKLHKWSFISITKRHQTDPLFPMALRQTHPVLFWNEKLLVTKTQGAKMSLQTCWKSQARFSLQVFINLAELNRGNVSVFNTFLIKFANISLGLWCFDEREHYANPWRERQGVTRGSQNEVEEKAKASCCI